MDNDTIISINQVSKRYNQADYVLDNISLNIARGEFHLFLGWSGCGKSTLLNIIAGFVEKTSGWVLFDGEEVQKPGFERGVVFQNADSAIFPWITVWKNVEYGLRIRKVPVKS